MISVCKIDELERLHLVDVAPGLARKKVQRLRCFTMGKRKRHYELNTATSVLGRLHKLSRLSTSAIILPLQQSDDLFALHAREALQKLLDRIARLQVIEPTLHRHTRLDKNQLAAEGLRVFG